MSIQRIKRLVLEDQYEFSTHAIDEMDDDDLAEADVRFILLNGTLFQTLTEDPRGERFVVRCFLTQVGYNFDVVCRILLSGLLRVITVYRVDE